MKVNLKLNIDFERLEDLKKEYGKENVEKAITMMLVDYFEEEEEGIGKIKVEDIDIGDF